MASVRGMGVALMLSWCGTMRPRTVSPFLVSARRWPTPKRCCSSTMDRPSRWNSTWSWISACVPTTSCTLPSATAAAASRRALAVRLPVIQAMFTPSGCNHAASLRKCCSARISVGAINATWAPAAMAWAAAMAATTVLPLPTSPCNRRCIGYGCARSAAISRTTRCCAPVNERQGFVQPGHHPVRRVAGRQRRGFLDAPRAAGGGQRQLLRQQLVELDAPPCRVNPFQQRLLRLALRRRVQRADGGLEQRQRIALARHRRQGVGQVGAIQRLRDGAAQRQLRQAFGAGIDGSERGGQRRIGVDHARVHHLAAEQAAADLAARAQTLAHGHLLLLARVEIQPAQLQLTAVVGQRGRQLTPGAVQDLGFDLAFDLRGKARPQRGDRNHAGLVFIAQRQMQHEVFGRHQTDCGACAPYPSAVCRRRPWRALALRRPAWRNAPR